MIAAALSLEPAIRQRLAISGAVQGVGFRPFVYREAMARGLTGWVRNAAEGVVIEVEGPPGTIAGLIAAIRTKPPVHARITDIAILEIAAEGDSGFAVRPSDTAGARQAEVLPDLAPCDACLAEMRDPTNRRYRYPFVNCTQCGPRYSIVADIPYDRARTSMRHFTLCPDCRAEYEDPANRRFHAEPNACPACGPRLALWDESGEELAQGDTALVTAAQAIRDGRIVAVKGIGGFHLMVDARNDAAVQRLRALKRRPEKPFAMLFPTLDAVRAACHVGEAAAALLTDAARPIVLLPRHAGVIADAVAPDSARLGAMLPCSPLHHLLMDELSFPVVATSGNIAGDPIVTDEKDALARLGGIADLFLVHDRPILRPVDDSVAQIVCGEPQLLRRSRGYAPAPVADGLAEGILAVGGHLKVTVASGKMLSQHLGDLETAAARRVHGEALADLVRMQGAEPRLTACDLHPDYASTRAAEATGLPWVAVQHHVAHAAACLAEHGLRPPALGIAWDGTGYGTDGTIWGGEFLHLTETGWSRAARLRPFPLPGAEAAAREPRRAALGLLYAAFGEEGLSLSDAFTPEERAVLRTMLVRGINSPQTSSMGRLFDAIASLCGIRHKTSYEGQAAAALEALAADSVSDGYDLPVRSDDTGLIVDWQPALDAILADRRAGVDVGVISARWHNGLAAAIVAVAQRIDEPRVALTGGCFQNTRLTESAVTALRNAGFAPLWHRKVPPNDGGLALGQAAWASWSLERGDVPCA